jgi:hypothetical protein
LNPSHSLERNWRKNFSISPRQIFQDYQRLLTPIIEDSQKLHIKSSKLSTCSVVRIATLAIKFNLFLNYEVLPHVPGKKLVHHIRRHIINES